MVHVTTTAYYHALSPTKDYKLIAYGSFYALQILLGAIYHIPYAIQIII